jgi:N6-L-threonylcarbamoyladenine synthase
MCHNMIILGIETSCDETAVSLIEGKNGRVREIESLVASQIDIHAVTGGVVPEVAAREHVHAIIPLIDTLLGKRSAKGDIDAIAVTAGPGLFSSLMVGVETAKALSYAWGIPLVRVNHIEGHLCSSLINETRTLAFPAIALIVSGGHTEIINVKGHGKYKLVGRTRDDAAGEAFDKTAQMLGLGYPGGPAIAAAAEKGDATAFKLPRPMLGEDNFDFSFAGLKTAVLYKWRDLGAASHGSRAVSDMAASVQAAIVEVLVEKTFRAINKFKAKTLIVGGGVIANESLRATLAAYGKKEFPKLDIRLPLRKYTTDNATMIAAAGYFHTASSSSPSLGQARGKLKRGSMDWSKIKADPNWELV